MKTVLPILLILVLLWSCGKQGDVKPTSTVTTNTPITAAPDPTVKLTHDDSTHIVAFIVYPQNVKTAVTGKTLTLKFDENVNLFLLADGYKHTSAIHIKEDLKKTVLAAFDFTTENENGQTTFNFVDDNLNNVKFKTISDTLIQGVKVKKVNVHRQLTFSKVYASAQLAIDQQSLVLGRYEDLITFSSYTYYNQKTYPVTSAVAYVKYGK
jgi:hypothetical protein